MVVAVNPNPNQGEFEILLNNTVRTLKDKSVLQLNKYSGLLGKKLENEVFDILSSKARGTSFEGSIELVSGQKFPDIVAKRFYGVEVKTTKSNHWKSIGSSIAEGTRIAGVERIFMLFGKMCDPMDFMCKPYEDCLSEVVVTHSPRYLIDMNLRKGETIFDKINLPYDVLRKQSNPIETVLNYYKGNLKPGEATWWSGQGDFNITNNIIIKSWGNLSYYEKKEYMIKGFCLFPELISKDPNKFNRYTLWLSACEGIVCPNVRDQYTAGGQGEITFQNNKYKKIPRIVIKMTSHLKDIKIMLNSLNHEDIEKYWGYRIDRENLYYIWCSLVIMNADKSLKKIFPLDEYLKEM
jgi:hypothetical protein